MSGKNIIINYIYKMSEDQDQQQLQQEEVLGGENIEQKFNQFLEENKIDISSLKGTKDEGRLQEEAQKQRNLAILKLVSVIHNQSISE